MFYYTVYCTSKALVSTSSSEEHRAAELKVSFDALDITCTAMGVYEMLKVSLKSFISFTPLLELQKNDDHRTVILSKLRPWAPPPRNKVNFSLASLNS